MPETALTYQCLKLEASSQTPIQVFQNLSGRKKFLLESTFTHEKKGKFSFLGMNPYKEIIGRLGETTIIKLKTNEKEKKKIHALHYLKELPIMETDLPVPFFGGAVGYVGYETIRDFENIGKPLSNELDMPEIHFMLFKDIIVFDHMEQSIYLIAINPEEVIDDELDKRIQLLKEIIATTSSTSSQRLEQTQFQLEETEASFKEKVALAKDYIRKGDVLQVVLSQRMTAKVAHEEEYGLAFYQSLRENNPSPYMFYLDFEDYHLLGASPESLLQVMGKEVITNPIAGTRPRGRSEEEDWQLQAELLSDEKELSEHRMLVELSKEDMVRVCKENTIQVTTDKIIEKYQHVMHIVSEVKGRLRKGFTSVDALIACLPAGTVSGAPKLRAMQIINDLEGKMRGPYGGGVGYINFNGDLNMALTIRSLVIQSERAYLQAGAGIVKGSDPKKEYEETLHKARALLEAAQVYK